jgi:hypothetical protein
MPSALAIFLALLLISMVLAGIGWGMVYRLTPEHKRRKSLRWLGVWSLKGLVLPLAIWLLMNIGLSWNLQPFMPQIQAAQNSGTGWAAEFLKVMAKGLFIVSSYWSALTLGWALVGVIKGIEGEARDDFKALCWTCFIGMSLPCVGLVLLGGTATLGLSVAAMLTPIAGYAPSLLHLQKMPPMYARAIAKMKFGKYSEAEWEIIRELEKCEDDFEGWMMMADLYANHFRDMREAEQTVLEICEQPKTTASQLSVALHRLADWYLKLAGDPDGARRALQIVCDRTRGTHLSHMAQLRINQLPVSAEDLRQDQMNRPIPLPALGNSLDDGPTPAASHLPHHEAVEMANACVERLKVDPNNTSAREKLARLFAEDLGKPDLGIEQLALLLEMPDQEDARRAEWLSLTAAWHIKYRQDSETGRRTLEKLVSEFPQSVQAFAARRRIQLMLRGDA